MREAVDDLVRSVGEALTPLAAVRVAWLFGSRVAGRPRPDSDLDVGVVFVDRLDAHARHCARLDVVAALTDALGSLGERADVVDLMDCDSAVAFGALRDGRCVLARTREERVLSAARIARRYDDDAGRRALFVRAARRTTGGPR